MTRARRKAKAAARPFCMDFSCPAMWTCARFFGRSENYWRFDLEADEAEGVTFYKGPRNPRRAECEDWERDQPRPWLVEAFAPVGGPKAPPSLQLRLFTVVEGSA